VIHTLDLAEENGSVFESEVEALVDLICIPSSRKGEETEDLEREIRGCLFSKV